MKVLEIIKAEEMPIYMVYGLVGLTVANEMWSIPVVNGIVSILCIGVLMIRRFIK